MKLVESLFRRNHEAPVPVVPDFEEIRSRAAEIEPTLAGQDRRILEEFRAQRQAQLDQEANARREALKSQGIVVRR